MQTHTIKDVYARCSSDIFKEQLYGKTIYSMFDYSNYVPIYVLPH